MKVSEVSNLARHVKTYHVLKEGSDETKCPDCPNTWYSTETKGRHEPDCLKTNVHNSSLDQGSFDSRAGNVQFNHEDQPLTISPAHLSTSAAPPNPVNHDSPSLAAVRPPIPDTAIRRQIQRRAQVLITEKATGEPDGTWQCKYCEFKPTTRQGVYDHFLTHFPRGRIPCEYCNANPTRKKYNEHYRNIHDPMQNEPKAEAGFKVKCEDCEQAWYGRGDTAREEHEGMCPFPNRVLREGWRQDPESDVFVREEAGYAVVANAPRTRAPEVYAEATRKQRVSSTHDPADEATPVPDQTFQEPGAFENPHHSPDWRYHITSVEVPPTTPTHTHPKLELALSKNPYNLVFPPCVIRVRQTPTQKVRIRHRYYPTSSSSMRSFVNRLLRAPSRNNPSSFASHFVSFAGTPIFSSSRNYGAHYRNIHDPTQNEPKAEAGFKVKCEDCKQAWHARGNKAEEAHRKVCPVPGGVLREGWRKDRDTGKFVRDNGDEAPPAGLSKSGNPEVLNPASPLTIESRRRQHVGTYLRDGTPGSSSPIPQVTSLDESSRRSGEFRAFEDPSASRQNDPDTDVSDWPSSLDPIQDSGREHRRRTRTNDRNPHVPKARRARPHTRSTVVPHPPRSSPDTVTPTRRNTPQFIEVPYKQFFDEIFQDPTPASPKSLSKRFSSLHLSSRKSHQYPDLL
ncbi:hypothetical protein JCM16303_003400 [Sporobolomyces ruberrimus]